MCDAESNQTSDTKMGFLIASFEVKPHNCYEKHMSKKEQKCKSGKYLAERTVLMFLTQFSIFINSKTALKHMQNFTYRNFDETTLIQRLNKIKRKQLAWKS